MTVARTIRWVLLAAVLAAAGFYGWQRFHGESQATAEQCAETGTQSGSRHHRPGPES